MLRFLLLEESFITSKLLYYAILFHKLTILNIFTCSTIFFLARVLRFGKIDVSEFHIARIWPGPEAAERRQTMLDPNLFLVSLQVENNLP